MTILTAQPWGTNAAMIADVASLGYLDGRVLDATYGLGVFWKQWQPKELVGCDIDPAKARDFVADFRNLPFADGSFDSVVLDGPYKLNGTPTEDVDSRYGVHIASTWQDRLSLIIDGITECARVTRRHLLVKCQDQVVSGKKRWQTIVFAGAGVAAGLSLVDRFDMLTTPRPQPPGRRQVHSQQNYSTLWVFSK